MPREKCKDGVEGKEINKTGEGKLYIIEFCFSLQFQASSSKPKGNSIHCTIFHLVQISSMNKQLDFYQTTGNLPKAQPSDMLAKLELDKTFMRKTHRFSGCDFHKCWCSERAAL